MTIGVAIVGSGIFARSQHLPAVQAASSQLTLKAIYSRTLKSATALAEEAGGSKIDLYSDDAGSGNTYHDLLLRDDIQGVMLALPILSQSEYIEAALLAGKHVLSEKPIAGDLKAAERLISFYAEKVDKSKVIWAVAENFRFMESLLYAAQEIQKMGKILGFSGKMHTNVKSGTKYIETSWRKAPEYQGGFLLDGGVHFVAATRLLLGQSARPTALSAFTTLLRPHLLPVDTVNSVWQTETGVSGTFSVSFGSTLSANEYTVICEKGTVTVPRGKVIIQTGEGEDEKTVEKDFSDTEGNGVKQEVAAWALSIAEGKANPRQSPQEALADLEILEKMLRSGEGHGKTESLQLQV